MRAIARRTDGTLKHEIEFGSDHRVVADEAEEDGGTDEGPSPQELLAASLASCSAITMEMYAIRKGWDIGEVVVDVDYEPAQRGSPTKFHMTVKLPKELPRGAAAAAHADRGQVPGAPYARGRGHVRRDARARVTTAADLRPLLLSPEEAAALDAPGTKDAAVLVPLYLDSGALHAVFTKRRDDLKRHAGEISFPGGRQDFPDEDLRTTALREAEEEIGLAPADVELGGRARAGRHVRDELQDPPVRRRHQAGARVDARSRPRSRRCSSCRCRTSGAGSSTSG